METNIGSPAALQVPLAPERPALAFELCCFGSPAFRELLALRSKVNRRGGISTPDAVDEHSEHYSARLGDRLVGALRVTRAAAGPLDCEEHYPPSLLHQWRSLLTSAGSFAVDASVSPELRVARRLIEFAWLDQLPRGSRLDVINVHERAITYYGILGYELLADSFFIHPRLGTPSHVMVFPAAPLLCSPLAHLFEQLTDPFSVSDLGVRLTPWRDRLPVPAGAVGESSDN